ncbi:MAG: glycoside hydrolase family 3 N-terminal domain-containing protein [Bacteroidales bacterium]
MIRSYRFLIVSILMAALTSFSFNYNDDMPGDDRTGASLLPLQASWVDSVYKKMTLDEKIGQLFMVAAYSNKGPEHTQDILKLIRKYNIGGLIFFQGTPRKQIKLTNIYQNHSEVPLMIAMDAEWGLGMRLDSTMSYPRQMTLGAIQNDSLIYQMGLDIGEQLRRMGVHINFAPVVDINSNPDNPVIGSRSFGEDKHNVAGKGLAYMNGLQDRRVMAVAKHFPGHGDTDQDSHETLPSIMHDSLRLDSMELFPFKELINNGVGGVMTAHLSIPALVKERNRPSTLSKNVVTNLLKDTLNFNGLVFTDALNMGGVTDYFEPGQIEVEALKAGNDVLLYPQDVPLAIEYIKRQVRKGLISEGQINESCRRILAFKYWTGLDKYTADKEDSTQEFIKNENFHEDLHKPGYKATKRQLDEGALTLLYNNDSVLPIKRMDTLQVVSVMFGDDEFPADFQKRIDYYSEIKHYNDTVPFNLSFLEELAGNDLVIAGIAGTNELKHRNYGVKREYIDFLHQLARQTTVIPVYFGNPYLLSSNFDFYKFPALLLGYYDNPEMQDLAAQAVFGGAPVTGQLPVSIDDYFQSGSGETIDKSVRLKYTVPEDAGMSSKKLSKVDSIVEQAIRDTVTPGSQILAAKDGKVFLHKSYGHHTYLEEQPVVWKDMYDIASVTKIVAALPAIMKYYEEGQISLSDSLGKFLPRLDTTDKSGLIIKDILRHQARLKSWIPFYQALLETFYPGENLVSSSFSSRYPYKLGAGSYMSKNFQFKEGVVSSTPNDTFSIKVANNMYLHESYYDSVFAMIDRSELLEKKEYIYSDLGYYYFYEMIEELSGKPFEEYVKKNFYSPIGAGRMFFLPLRNFDKKHIVPTENDMIFRKQLLQGYVHDPGTAMLGGVCGHAGVFSNANDLGKMMQMYLNGGEYGGYQFLQDTTLDMFTKSPKDDENDNRRALGFDKPVTEEGEEGPTFSGISENSFGHTGFTGTITWADRDENLIYIFLSNRIHPDQDNRKLIEDDIRTKIQEAIYDAIEE